MIYSKLKNLKYYNEARKSQNKRPHYITEHLPKQFQLERKVLLPHFKEARRLNKKTSWKAENGHYNMYIDNAKFQPWSVSLANLVFINISVEASSSVSK